MTEFKERLLRQDFVLSDLDDTLIPTLEKMWDWMDRSGFPYTKEQVLATPLGYNPNREINSIQLGLIRDPNFLRALEPFLETSEALLLLARNGLPYASWSARSVEPEELREATVDWIRLTLDPPPIRVLLKAESKYPGAMFKAIAYLSILQGSMNTEDIEYNPVAALEDDLKAGKILASMGLNVFMINSSGKDQSAYPQLRPPMHGPYGSVKDAVDELIVFYQRSLLSKKPLEKENNLKLSPIRNMVLHTKEGLINLAQ